MNCDSDFNHYFTGPQADTFIFFSTNQSLSNLEVVQYFCNAIIHWIASK